MGTLSVDDHIRKTVVEGIAKHPFISAAILSVLIHVFTFGGEWNIPDNAVWFENAFVMALVIYFIHRANAGKKNRVVFLIGTVAAVIIDLIVLKIYSSSANIALWHLFGGFALVLAICAFLYDGTNGARVNSLLLIGGGIVFRLYYILRASCFDRQHDVGIFNAEDYGHFGYIQYLIDYKHLPDFDIRPHAQFFHPPFYHTIAGMWIDFNETILGVNHDSSREGLQSLSLFISILIIIVTYKILTRLNINSRGKMAALLIVCFHPAMILHAASLNNDQLTTFFILLTVYNTLVWFRSRRTADIVKTALSIGLGMMTKLSAAVIAPPVGAVFIVALIANWKKEKFVLIRQYLLFLIVCVPLGLWFNIRNLIKWGIPLNYMWAMKPDNPMYLGDTPFIDRILDFDLYQFAVPFERFTERGATYKEHNPLIAIMKNFLFGEYISEYSFGSMPEGEKAAFVLFLLGIALAVIVFIAAVAVMIGDRSLKAFPKLFLAGVYLFSMAGFYYMCSDQPYVCTMNSRYLVHVLVISAIFFGAFISWSGRWKFRFCKVIPAIPVVLILLFIALTIFVYIAVLSPEPVYPAVIITLLAATAFSIVWVGHLCKNKTSKSMEKKSV
ncbi:MAG: glycosyltransferase family 39 protein [Clostridiales bacterium]|nr:glycosyltransferase family 39 protein [Clostridiales bacterium]